MIRRRTGQGRGGEHYVLVEEEGELARICATTATTLSRILRDTLARHSSVRGKVRSSIWWGWGEWGQG